ncbi:hypothetical protein DKX38_007622 [Salix brachista]|uniref:protein-serine/threonine phosphatase n=1 Tax=Salix brachista TaxID=2182728 RepID=A0A5N5MQL2_9ROSI|nr:hypothetical protein DKX38_007622 [Salix brachista]
MVQETCASLQIERLDGGCSGTSKGSASAMEDEKDENLDSLNQQNAGKPPRNIKMEILGLISPSTENSALLPIFRSGSWTEKGPKEYMEDEHICVDNLHKHLATSADFPSPGAFYGVFDGHGGIDAASFTRKNILNFIVEDSQFPSGTKRAIKSAFVKADHALSDTKSIDSSSGTTALMALVLGRTMLVANAGDSRAVLGKRGRAIELSKDHKPSCASERTRIERLGGVIYDGYLNGQLSVARALGDWHIKGPKGSKSPLSSEPEVEEINLTEEDEFLILGCDGLWDVMSSQCAVTMVRKELMLHNDPEICSKALVTEALERNTCDNLTVLVICFSPDPPPKIEIPKNHRRRSISAEGLDRVKGILNN